MATMQGHLLWHIVALLMAFLWGQPCVGIRQRPQQLMAALGQTHSQQMGFIRVNSTVTTSGQASSWLAGAYNPQAQVTEQGIRIPLCECERALGEPGGLSCAKEGWFISNFENEGTWMAGGGLVPLSHAVCCRPCMPDTLPDTAPAQLKAALAAATTQPDSTLAAAVQGPSSTSAAAAVSITPLAILSLGCHAASNKASNSLSCEQEGSSVVAGFARAEPVSLFYDDIYFPLSQVECCTPVLLLPDGDVWPLQRCNCQLSWTKDCGGMTTHQLLWGFGDWRLTHDGEALPVAPLQCCQLCLADSPADAASCRDLGFCNGGGACVLGACQCYDGWSGPDCSVDDRSAADDLLNMPWWAAALSIIGLAIFVFGIVVAVRVFYEGVHLNQGNNNRPNELTAANLDQLSLPLLLNLINDAGSVGSQDTEPEEELDGPETDENGEQHVDQEAEEEEEEEEEEDGGDDAEAEETHELCDADESGSAGSLAYEGQPLLPPPPGGGGAAGASGSGTGGGHSRVTSEQAGGDTAGIAAPREGVQVVHTAGLSVPTGAVNRGRRRHLGGGGGGGAVIANGGAVAAHEARDGGDAAAGGSASVQAGAEVGSSAEHHDGGVVDGNVGGVDGEEEEEGEHEEGEYASVEGGDDDTTHMLSTAAPTGQHQSSHSIPGGQLGSQLSGFRAAVGRAGGVSAAGSRQGHGEQGGATTPSCVVCMEQPVQAVLVPCGHACICRRCSRRLARCPLCRQVIHRRQRLYLGVTP